MTSVLLLAAQVEVVASSFSGIKIYMLRSYRIRNITLMFLYGSTWRLTHMYGETQIRESYKTWYMLSLSELCLIYPGCY